MGSGLSFPTCALFINALLCIMFFFRKHLNNTETRLYSWLIVTNLCALTLEFLCTFSTVIYSVYPIVSNIIFKLYLVSLITWIIIFIMYIYVISNNQESVIKNKKPRLLVVKTVYYLSVLITFLLPIELVVKDNFTVRYTTGPSVNFIYIISSVFIGYLVYCLIKNYKNLKSKKYLPVFVFLAIGSIAMYLQMFNPSLLLMTSVETYVILLMYFTIENPDMRMIEEMMKSKGRVDTANENKLMFVYNIVQNLKNPINNVKHILDESSKEESLSIIKRNIHDIEIENNRMSMVINNVLDISTINSENIKVYNKEYDIKRLITELKLRYKGMIKDNVQLIISLSDDIPDYLYGDSVRLKQVLNSLFENAIKYTEKGFIEIAVSFIVKRDVCRLLITIEDSGVGMDLDESSVVFQSNEEIPNELEKSSMDLSSVKKLVDCIGGTIMLESEKHKGTKVTVVLDQKIPELKENDTYKNMVINKKNVLIIDKNSNVLREDTKMFFYNKNIRTEYLEFGAVALEKVRFKTDKYDMIVINDNIEGVSCEKIIDALVNEEKYDGKILVISPNTRINLYKNKKVFNVLDDSLSVKEVEQIIIKSL